MTRSTDVLILGAGAIGLSSAWYLLAGGREVTLLDQGTPGCGSSHGNCGTITPSHAPPLAKPGMVRQALEWMLREDAPFYVRPRLDPTLWRWLWDFARHCNWRDFRPALEAKARLLLESRRLLAELIREAALDCEYRECGHLTVFTDPQALDAFAWWPRALHEVGIEVHAYDGAALRQREPCLRDRVIGGFDTPIDAMFKPDRFVAELAARVGTAGARIHGGDAVVSIDPDAGLVRTASGAQWRARDIVIALGAWSPLLARQLGLRLPVQPGKGYSITSTLPRSVPTVPIVCRERSVAITPWQHTFRLGSTMEFSGYDASLNRTRIEALVRGASEYLHDPIGETRLEEWSGWRPMTHDDIPIIGAAPGHQCLWVATGHGMLGMSMAAGTGLLLADLLLGRAPTIDPRPYSPKRFH